MRIDKWFCMYVPLLTINISWKVFIETKINMNLQSSLYNGVDKYDKNKLKRPLRNN